MPRQHGAEHLRGLAILVPYRLEQPPEEMKEIGAILTLCADQDIRDDFLKARIPPEKGGRVAARITVKLGEMARRFPPFLRVLTGTLLRSVLTAKFNGEEETDPPALRQDRWLLTLRRSPLFQPKDVRYHAIDDNGKWNPHHKLGDIDWESTDPENFKVRVYLRMRRFYRVRNNGQEPSAVMCLLMKGWAVNIESDPRKWWQTKEGRERFPLVRALTCMQDNRTGAYNIAFAALDERLDEPEHRLLEREAQIPGYYAMHPALRMVLLLNHIAKLFRYPNLPLTMAPGLEQAPAGVILKELSDRVLSHVVCCGGVPPPKQATPQAGGPQHRPRMEHPPAPQQPFATAECWKSPLATSTLPPTGAQTGTAGAGPSTLSEPPPSPMDVDMVEPVPSQAPAQMGAGVGQPHQPVALPPFPNAALSEEQLRLAVWRSVSGNDVWRGIGIEPETLSFYQTVQSNVQLPIPYGAQHFPLRAFPWLTYPEMGEEPGPDFRGFLERHDVPIGRQPDLVAGLMGMAVYWVAARRREDTVAWRSSANSAIYRPKMYELGQEARRRVRSLFDGFPAEQRPVASAYNWITFPADL